MATISSAEPTGKAVSTPREIPFNYTSASDRQALSFLLGPEIARILDELHEKRVTGRSARLLLRMVGGILIHCRNPYLFQELVDSAARRRRIFGKAESDLSLIESTFDGDSRVAEVLAASRKLLERFRDDVVHTPERRKGIMRELAPICGKENVLFDPFTLVSHATDATDWRLFLPVAVVTPDREPQVALLLAAIERLGLKAIPRGAGTGLSGGAVPLRPNCVVINTERLNSIRGISEMSFQLDDGSKKVASVMEVEAGVITEVAAECANEHKLVFATDPTSAWSCTIGGNIAENAGGNKAVRWGTCIDNLVEWRMAMPSGTRWIVRRTDHRLRKILPQDTVTFEVVDENGTVLNRILLLGSEIRKNGLWKDITHKALGGVPGLQKEGTDGVITSAVFVLYPKYPMLKTLCLEFFGPDFDEASRVILELSRTFPFPSEENGALLSLEHFDDEYVRAIDYKVKAARTEIPKAALLIDIAGEDQAQVDRGEALVCRVLERYPNTVMFVARDVAESKLFWEDRKKMGAIARRTNAFKLNEDVVIPLDTLAEFARFVDATNIEEERYSQLQFVGKVEEILAAGAPSDEPNHIEEKITAGRALCSEVADCLQREEGRRLRSLNLLQELRRELREMLSGYPSVQSALDRAYTEVRDRRIVIATHMHAGDGNVHVNIPVLSNDRPMLDRADHVVDNVMSKVISLGGVVSGEHGIGVTKLKYLERERIEELSMYRKKIDPNGLMNPGKLEDYAALEHIFTPSFNMLEIEARILQYGQLEQLSKKIAHCVRCGKCKVNCCVYHPGRGMFYHPRNKNLAIGSLIEALLYDAQRERSTNFELLQWLEEVADHCTICHKCLKPCPVDIDTGEVSILEREILQAWGYKKKPALTQITLQYLESRSPIVNSLVRTTLIQIGGASQRIAAKIVSPFQPTKGPSPFYPLRLLRSSTAPVVSRTLRHVLPGCAPDEVLVFEPQTTEAKATVFYFPGCGSERLHSDISMATIHVLLELGTRVILPPPFLCCGFPALVNAKQDMHAQMVLRNTVLFSQIREMFSYLDIDACVISCGTCREGIAPTEAEKLFGGRIVDITRYAFEIGMLIDGRSENYLYHAPCHDSLDGKATHLLGKIGGFNSITNVNSCCSEAGTLSLSRPDITDDMLHRKREAIAESMGGEKSAVILTNCPSCVTGLGRNRDMGVEPLHTAVALAEKKSGPQWKDRFARQAQMAQPIRF